MPLRVCVPGCDVLVHTCVLAPWTQIAETASLGDAILGALYNQRRRLEGAVDHRNQLNAELQDSGSLMQRMSRRLSVRHFLWYSTIALLIAAIIVTIWWKVASGADAKD